MANNNDDLFDPLPPLNNSGNSNPNVPYTPPPYNPQQPPRKGPNPILMIILGVVIGMTCLCLGCFAIFGGTIAATVNGVMNDPTLRAAAGTLQSGFGTMGALVDLPTTLPANVDDQGSIKAGDTKTVTGSSGMVMWSYDGKSGEEITVTADAGSTGLVTVGIYGPENQLIKKSGILDGSSAKAITLTAQLTSNGTYHIVTGGASAQITIKLTSTPR